MPGKAGDTEIKHDIICSLYIEIDKNNTNNDDNDILCVVLKEKVG